LVATIGWLNLDHIGSHIAEQHAGIGPGHHLTDIQHPYTGQRQRTFADLIRPFVR